MRESVGTLRLISLETVSALGAVCAVTLSGSGSSHRLCCAATSLPPDQLQASPLAKELRIIARYAEGYDLGPGSILPTIEHVACLLYPKPMSASGYALPPDFHQTPL